MTPPVPDLSGAAPTLFPKIAKVGARTKQRSATGTHLTPLTPAPTRVDQEHRVRVAGKVEGTFPHRWCSVHLHYYWFLFVLLSLSPTSPPPSSSFLHRVLPFPLFYILSFHAICICDAAILVRGLAIASLDSFLSPPSTPFSSSTSRRCRLS